MSCVDGLVLDGPAGQWSLSARAGLSLGVGGSPEDEEAVPRLRPQSQRGRVGTRERRDGGDSWRLRNSR
jgi:hypothetical protein